MGVEVIVATGKSPLSAAAILDHLGLGKGGVYTQGLFLLGHDGQVLYERTLDSAVAHEIVAFSREHDLALVAYCGMQMLVEHRNAYTDTLIPYHEPVPAEVGRFEDVIGKLPINKLMFIAEPERISEARARLTALMDSRAAVVQAIPPMFEVLPHGASKGDGVRRFLELMKIPADQMLAVGDGENDIEMIQLAGVGVAMANARPELKAVADAVVASNDDDGVAAAVERFVLNA
jgi:Cof subfamily protein (haloacid dehalogenase superfamily)